MMFKLIKSEWIKVRKSPVWIPILIGPMLAIGLGMLDVNNNHEYKEGINRWVWMYPMLISFYSIMFLPLLSGIIASLLCRFEHLTGGWKQMLTLPVSRSKIYLTKLAYLYAALGFTQLLLLLGVLIAGFMRHITDPVPWLFIFKSLFGGWIALFPLAALQLFISTVWKSFGMPFAINIALTLPTIIVVNSDTLGPYYPWAQPFNAMLPSGNSPLYMVPSALVWVIIVGTFLTVSSGWLYFAKRDIYS